MHKQQGKEERKKIVINSKPKIISNTTPNHKENVAMN
jgi:hypothetical protein